MRFKIDWVILIVGSKFTLFALFYFVFEGNFPSTSPGGAYIWRGDLTECFLRYRFGGLLFGGAYFQILRYSQLESDVCRLRYTWSLNSLLALEYSRLFSLLSSSDVLQECLSCQTFLAAKKGEKRLYSQGQAIKS